LQKDEEAERVVGSESGRVAPKGQVKDDVYHHGITDAHLHRAAGPRRRHGYQRLKDRRRIYGS